MTAERDRARWALRDDPKLSKLAKLVWLMLDTRGPDPRPSLATLAANCRMARNTVKAALAELQDAGWLRIESRTTREGDSDTNRYVLICPGQTGVGSPADPPLEHGDDSGGWGHPLTYGRSAGDPPVGQLVTPEEVQREDQTEDQAALPRGPDCPVITPTGGSHQAESWPDADALAEYDASYHAQVAAYRDRQAPAETDSSDGEAAEDDGYSWKRSGQGSWSAFQRDHSRDWQSLSAGRASA